MDCIEEVRLACCCNPQKEADMPEVKTEPDTIKIKIKVRTLDKLETTMHTFDFR
jgi:hypothetical protein